MYTYAVTKFGAQKPLIALSIVIVTVIVIVNIIATAIATATRWRCV